MQRTLTIQNLTRGQLVLNLPSGLVPELSQPAPTPPTQPAPRARRVGDKRVALPGRSATRRAPTRLSGSVTLNARGTPGDEVRGLPPSAKRAPDVQAALKAEPPRVRVNLVVVQADGEQPVPRPRVPQQPAVPKGGAQ